VAEFGNVHGDSFERAGGFHRVSTRAVARQAENHAEAPPAGDSNMAGGTDK